MSTSTPAHRIILVDPTEATREHLAHRLRAQGYVVDEVADAAAGAELALSAPPSIVIADLWMPRISGVQLCRLLRSEPATADVAVVLLGGSDEPKDKFWAERAGANLFVQKHRTGEILRVVARTVALLLNDSPFFLQLADGTIDIRDRIARQLDDALFESVIASEVRALATSEELEGLFTMLVQFLARVTRYRWLALATTGQEPRLALHAAADDGAEREARVALGLPSSSPPCIRPDDDDTPVTSTRRCTPAIVQRVPFGNQTVATIAMSPRSPADAPAVEKLLALVARELGGAVRMAMLVEASQRLAASDPLTGLMNRRAFTAAIAREIERCRRHGGALSLLLLDVDHFKSINDRHGHAVGDRVLAELGSLLRDGPLRRDDLAARWGGEEFVVACVSTSADGARLAAERIRAAIGGLAILDADGERIFVTASIGVAELRDTDALERLVDRADRAMYAAKLGGRNRVASSEPEPEVTHASTVVRASRAPGVVRPSASPAMLAS